MRQDAASQPQVRELPLAVLLAHVKTPSVIPEISWLRNRQPSDVFVAGQRLTVKILYVIGYGKYAASLRAMHLELIPWRDPSLFDVGSEFTGHVARAMDYGYFVELRPGVSGLLHRDRWSRTYEAADRVAGPGRERRS